MSQGLARLSASWVTVPVLPLRLKDCDTHIQIIFAQGAEVPRKFFVGTMDTYPGTYQEEGVCKFVGKIEFVINAGAECSFAKRNNSVIRGTNTVFRMFKRKDHGGAYAHLHACDSRGAFCHSYPNVFGERPPLLLQSV